MLSKSDTKARPEAEAEAEDDEGEITVDFEDHESPTRERRSMLVRGKKKHLDFARGMIATFRRAPANAIQTAINAMLKHKAKEGKQARPEPRKRRGKLCEPAFT